MASRKRKCLGKKEHDFWNWGKWWKIILGEKWQVHSSRRRKCLRKKEQKKILDKEAHFTCLKRCFAKYTKRLLSALLGSKGTNDNFWGLWGTQWGFRVISDVLRGPMEDLWTMVTSVGPKRSYGRPKVTYGEIKETQGDFWGLKGAMYNILGR